jgi:hypothetical protein
MGHLEFVDFDSRSAERFLRGMKKGHLARQERRDAAMTALERLVYRQPNSRKLVAQCVEAIDACAIFEESELRLRLLIELLTFAPSSVFWPCLFSNFSSCDDTWRYKDRLLTIMKRQVPAATFYSEEQREFFDGLPDVVHVFRGCSSNRRNGISWTTSAKVAAGFARGHRGIRVPRPVVVEGSVPKTRIIAVLTDRDEQELILNPKDVTMSGCGCEQPCRRRCMIPSTFGNG